MAEKTTFAALALALHVLAMGEVLKGGAEAGGTGGEALVSVRAAAAQIETMVAQWDRPPDAQQVVEMAEPLVPTVDQTTPDRVAVDLPTAPRANARLTTQEAATSPKLPEVDTQAPQPPGASVEEAPQLPKPQADPPKPKAQPAEKPQSASAGRAAQKAAGQGGSQSAGQNGASSVKTASKGQQDKALAVWGAKVRNRIERAKRYPSGTRATGRVVVGLVVSRDGRLLSVSLRKSSGDPKLDQAALAAVKRAGKFAKAPKELTKTQYTFSLPIGFAR
ncbi:TonB family protein [Shimia biformata]|uniref:TonB family protein n=1 Tax=Shimia biformata TaxID=1294299 RepID=UPI00194E7C5A